MIIKGLYGKYDLEFAFNDDLNLLTGLNGCGKTTLLKTLWFVNSGHFIELAQEVPFKSLVVTSDKYKVKLFSKDDCLNVNIHDYEGNEQSYNVNISNTIITKRDYLGLSRDFANKSCDSIFFPTFRRIEGGFSMENRGVRYRRNSFPIKDALCDLSEELSSDKHQFIAYVSTDDIVSLISRETSTIVRKINEMQKSKFEEISKRIKHKYDMKPEEILAEIESDIYSVEQERNNAMEPFTLLENLIISVFRKKSINIDNITLGEFEDTISSDKLSAGEKQMLSFLCYNTFSNNNVIFIDEPELSLHPDWQRLLIPTLLGQNKNQFFIATHSPFIYTKYPDKEIIIDIDKGE